MSKETEKETEKETTYSTAFVHSCWLHISLLLYFCCTVFQLTVELHVMYDLDLFQDISTPKMLTGIQLCLQMIILYFLPYNTQSASNFLT